MNCPTCRSPCKVRDSRRVGEIRRRRYECVKCSERFSTAENVVSTHEAERHRRWTELSALYCVNRQQWAEVKQHVQWLYGQLKLAKSKERASR